MEFNQTNYTTVDIFERIHEERRRPDRSVSEIESRLLFFPETGRRNRVPRMMFRGREVLNWSLNNYLGLANNPEVRKADAEAAAEFGMAYPMGGAYDERQNQMARTAERELAAFVGKPDAFLLNYGGIRG